MSKFKIGDKVKVIYATNYDNSLGICAGDVGEVFQYGINPDICHVNFAQTRGRGAVNQAMVDEQLEIVPKVKFKIDPVKYNIVMYRKGNTVVAQLHKGKTVIATAEAKCSPDDEFNFFIGSQIALQRLVYGFNKSPIVVPEETRFGDIFVY